MNKGRLIKIRHYRCGEPDGSSYVIAPESKTNEQIEADVDAAAEELIKSIEGFKELHNSTPPKAYPRVEDYSEDLTLKEIKVLMESDRQKRKDFDARKRQATASYESFLYKKGYEWIGECEDEFEISWGHRHGMRLDYGNNDFGYQPLKVGKKNGDTVSALWDDDED